MCVGYVSVSPACMYVRHVCASCSRRLEEGIVWSGTGIMDDVSLLSHLSHPPGFFFSRSLCAHICACIYVCTCICACIWVCMHCVSVCAYVCAYVCVHICVRVCTYACMWRSEENLGNAVHLIF